MVVPVAVLPTTTMEELEEVGDSVGLLRSVKVANWADCLISETR